MLCFFFGHRWKRFGCNTGKNAVLGHLHTQAGYIEVCKRCKVMWDDFLWERDRGDPRMIEFYHHTRERAKQYIEASQ